MGSEKRDEFFNAFCVFKITYMKSECDHWDDRIMEAMKAAHPLMPAPPNTSENGYDD